MRKPEIDAVKQYGREIGLSTFECEKFHDYFESNGWKVARNAMKDWKAAMRNWLRNVSRAGFQRSRTLPNKQPGTRW